MYVGGLCDHLGESAGWLAGEAVPIAPVSAWISLQTGNFAGNFRRTPRRNLLSLKISPLNLILGGIFPTVENREKLYLIREVLFKFGDCDEMKVQATAVKAKRTLTLLRRMGH